MKEERGSHESSKNSSAPVASSFIAAFIALPATAKTFVYVSCAVDGGRHAGMNLDAVIKNDGKARRKTVMPMAVSPDRRFYMPPSVRPYAIASYSIDSNKGELTHLSTVPLPDNMAYISTDKTGRFLFSASYAGHKISVNPIGGKGLVQPDPTQVLITGRNPHSILSDPSNRFVYVPNLGSDQVMQFCLTRKPAS
jgi:6-phosphogluconolactonase